MIKRTDTYPRRYIEPGVLKPYKEIIKSCICPDSGSLNYIGAQKAIEAYQTIGDDFGVLELMVFYVEKGNEFTSELGTIDEEFYENIEDMFIKITEKLKLMESKYTDIFLPRLKAIVKEAENTPDYGYYDILEETLDHAFPE